MPKDPASLDRLHDLAAPPPVPWWPPAPGWYVIGALVLIAAGIGAWRWWRRWRSQAYRRAALAELKEWESGRVPGEPLAPDDLAYLSALLRRTVLAVLPREQVTGLAEPEWIALLDESFPDASAPSWEWMEAVYQKSEKLSAEQSRQAIAEVRRWIKHHQLPAPRSGPSCAGSV